MNLVLLSWSLFVFFFFLFPTQICFCALKGLFLPEGQSANTVAKKKTTTLYYNQEKWHKMKELSRYSPHRKYWKILQHSLLFLVDVQRY